MEHKDDLIRYRIQRAEKTLLEAKWAIEVASFGQILNACGDFQQQGAQGTRR